MVRGLSRSLGERYQSLFVIGQGGMGTIEAAVERGEGGFERIVALKRLLPEGAKTERHREMFLREARLAALLSHPNVVHAFAFGELDGEYYLAMEYVEGEPLSRVVAAASERGEREGLAPTLVAHLLADVCDGLHAAHELRDVGGAMLNVVHRDISPHNVMVAYDGHVKLLDFGIAKVDSTAHVTKTGEVKGKMAYMSPEQAMGEPLDRRSDLYAIGAVLFECLTGRRMWGEGTDMDVMRKLALEPAPSLAQAAADAPPALARLHARLVARSPAERPAHAREVADALRAYVASTSPHADATVARALMERLFEAEAEARRRKLNEALHQVAPARAEVLRPSLRVGAPVTDVGAATTAASGAARGRGRLALVAGVAVLALGAAGALATSGRRAGGVTAASGAVPLAPPTTPPTTTSPSAPTTISTSAPATTSTHTLPSIPTPSAVSAPASVRRPSIGLPAPRPSPSPRASASARSVDVDPAPF